MDVQSNEGEMPEDNVFQTAITMPCRLGLHLRTAGRFLKFAGQFESDIRIRKGTIEADGKSIIGLLMLGACYGAVLHIETRGIDAAKAAREIDLYFENTDNCDED